MANQQVPSGYYHLDRMIESAARHGAEVGCCGSCLDARGISDDLVSKGARRSGPDELADWAAWADKVAAFWSARRRGTAASRTAWILPPPPATISSALGEPVYRSLPCQLVDLLIARGHASATLGSV